MYELDQRFSYRTSLVEFNYQGPGPWRSNARVGHGY